MARKILHADLAQLGFDLFLADAESLGNAVAFEMPMVIFPPRSRETSMPLVSRGARKADI
jgi:hypothetical protein